jgi:hypothetical protein
MADEAAIFEAKQLVDGAIQLGKHVFQDLGDMVTSRQMAERNQESVRQAGLIANSHVTEVSAASIEGKKIGYLISQPGTNHDLEFDTWKVDDLVASNCRTDMNGPLTVPNLPVFALASAQDLDLVPTAELQQILERWDAIAENESAFSNRFDEAMSILDQATELAESSTSQETESKTVQRQTYRVEYT